MNSSWAGWRQRLHPVLVLLAALGTICSHPRTALAATDTSFPRPRELAPAVEFWRKIFTTYSEHQVVVHDSWYMGKVYDVIDFRPWAQGAETPEFALETLKRNETEAAKERVREMLYRLHRAGSQPTGLSREEQRIFALFRDVDEPDKFLAAAERVRSQAGLREKFAAGIAIQNRYLPRMEQVFRDAGMPVELVRLPLIESCFNVQAHSKVGASGVWQFMPGTARLYMRVDGTVDERRDPIRATEAAAQHLRRDYEALGSWPLAITAYNHGRSGIARGVSTVGSTDIEDLVSRYRGPSFGFASRNFYAEFLAALDVVERRGQYFRNLQLEAPLRTREVEVPHSIGLFQAARILETSPSELLESNPAFGDRVAEGRAPIPAGYVLHLPGGSEDRADELARFEPVVEATDEEATTRHVARGLRYHRGSRGALHAGARRRGGRAVVVAKGHGGRQSAPLVVHQVRRGQTLTAIAKRYGTSVASLQSANNLRRGKDLQAGQRIRVRQRT